MYVFTFHTLLQCVNLTMTMANPSADELAPFILRDVEGLESGEKKGAGAYGAVYDVTVRGVPCIAKRLHDVLVNHKVSLKERASIWKSFRQECITLSKLKHPNIVHFIGVHYERVSSNLSLVMERLTTDLGAFLESTANIPLPLELSILLDVSYGLLYLHTLSPKPIIHRDLTASNILLTSDMRAKIADLGVSKLIDVHRRAEATHTKAPGSWNYMPPEALKEKAVYGVKLDIFSFGHLALYVATQNDPIVYEVTLTADVIRDGRLQILKRKKSINKMGEHHCFFPVVIRCLQDEPSKRPTTAELNKMLMQLCVRYPRNVSFDESVGVAGLMGDKDSLQNGKSGSSALAMSLQRESNVRFALERKNAELEKMNNQLRREIDSLRTENRQLKSKLENASPHHPSQLVSFPHPSQPQSLLGEATVTNQSQLPGWVENAAQFRQSYPPSPERRAKRQDNGKSYFMDPSRAHMRLNSEPFSKHVEIHKQTDQSNQPIKSAIQISQSNQPIYENFPPQHRHTKTCSVSTSDYVNKSLNDGQISQSNQPYYTCLKCGQRYGHRQLIEHAHLCPAGQK